jgi:NitT/TauT family transport system substrate-binding protein
MKIALSTLLILSSLLAGCQKAETPPPKKAEVPAVAPAPVVRKITIAQFGHVFLYLPLYVAKDKGFFAEQNLDVTLVSTGGDDKTFAAVAGGSAQFGVADPVFTAIAREQGKGGKVIASLVNGVPFWGVTFRKNLGEIDSPAKFAGLRFATYPSPSTNYAIMAETLKTAGVSGKSPIVQGAFGTLLALLKANKADVAMEIEPVASIAVKDGARVVYSAARKFGDFAVTGITATDELLAKDPELAQAVVTAIAKSVTWIRADFEGALAVAKTEFPEIPEDVLRNALRRILDDGIIPSTVILGEPAWNAAVQLRRSLGDIKGSATFADNADMRFAVKASAK